MAASDPGPISAVKPGMQVVDVGGVDLGTVKAVRMETPKRSLPMDSAKSPIPSWRSSLMRSLAASRASTHSAPNGSPESATS
jgi:hypothetical protein